MRLVYLSNYINHHQKPLADALFSLLGDDYHFIETTESPVFRKQLGYKKITGPHILRYNSETQQEIDKLVRDADVVILGEAPLQMVKRRIREGKLTIRDDESRYKNPNRYLKWPIYTYNSLFLNKGYLLCASAYAPIDYMLSGMNPRKCYRWGYFPEVKTYEDIEALFQKKKESSSRGVSILWTGRLIRLKHAEAAVYVAERLKRDGARFEMNIIGTGPLESKLKELIQRKGLDDSVHMLGSMPPENVRDYMERADIFLFTSDRGEGWGAVLNESMSSGCAVVADSNIGSVPYLIQDGVNGFIYKSRDYRYLYEKVLLLINNPSMRESLGRKAFLSMKETWNGVNAAKNLLLLCEALLKGEDTPIKEGPCSHAPLLMRKWRGRVPTL